MCGIVGIVNLKSQKHENLEKHLNVMNEIQAHRGPDGDGVWVNEHKTVGFGHKRLSIIDLSSNGKQPMIDKELTITFNGEVSELFRIKRRIKR